LETSSRTKLKNNHVQTEIELGNIEARNMWFFFVLNGDNKPLHSAKQEEEQCQKRRLTPTEWHPTKMNSKYQQSENVSLICSLSLLGR
jgi:hypothetical protein